MRAQRGPAASVVVGDIGDSAGFGDVAPASPSLDSTEATVSSDTRLVHPKRDHAPPRPLGRHVRRQRWTTPAELARYLGVVPDTVCSWIRSGRVACGTRVYEKHYTDDRERKTARGHWRIFEADLLALLKRMRVKGKPGFGPGFWKGVG